MRQDKRRLWPIRVLECTCGMALAVVGVGGMVYLDTLLLLPLAVAGVMFCLDGVA